MRYYGLSEVDARNPNAEKVSFYSLVLLFLTLSVFFVFIGISMNFLFGIVLFMAFSLAGIGIMYAHGAKERNLNAALACIPRISWIPASAYSTDRILKDLDDRIKEAEG